MALRRSPWGAKRKAVTQSEKAFQDQVIELAQTLNWWVWHPYYASRSPKGYPDLTLFRDRVIFAELKAQRKDGFGKLEPDQIEMAHRAYRAGAEYYCWWDTEDDWTEIKAVLSRGGTVKAT